MARKRSSVELGQPDGRVRRKTRAPDVSALRDLVGRQQDGATPVLDRAFDLATSLVLETNTTLSPAARRWLARHTRTRRRSQIWQVET